MRTAVALFLLFHPLLGSQLSPGRKGPEGKADGAASIGGISLSIPHRLVFRKGVISSGYMK